MRAANPSSRTPASVPLKRAPTVVLDAGQAAVRGCWNAILGGLTYTVPEGWANAGDWPASYTLKPKAGYDQYGKDWSDEIDVFAIPAAMLRATPARSRRTQRSVHSPVTSWRGSRSVPASLVTEPQPVTIGGYQGNGWTSPSTQPTPRPVPTTPPPIMLYWPSIRPAAATRGASARIASVTSSLTLVMATRSSSSSRRWTRPTSTRSWRRRCRSSRRSGSPA